LAAENNCRPSLRQKTLLQRFLAQPDGQYGLRRVLRSQHSFPAAYSHSFAVKTSGASMARMY
jgi:hypothetical protein